MKGVDPLAPAGTVTSVATVDRASAESTDRGVIVRKGLVFNWVPTRNLFIADPKANRLVVLDLTDNGVIFAATRRLIHAEEFNLPMDLAPATREISNGSFASNTTLGGGSDLYLQNRGNNSIVRMSIAGEVRGVRKIKSNVPNFRVNGITALPTGKRSMSPRPRRERAACFWPYRRLAALRLRLRFSCRRSRLGTRVI